MTAGDINAIARIDHTIIAQIRQLESVRPGLTKHLVEVFERNAVTFFEGIDVRINAGDTETLRIGFHSMKGTAASLGAQRLSHIAGIAERIASGDDASSSLLEITQALKLEFEATRIELMHAANT